MTALSETEQATLDRIEAAPAAEESWCSRCDGTREVMGDPCSKCNADGRLIAVRVTR